MWESPIYKFRILKDPENEDSTKLLEITMNVTNSAPKQNKPSGKLTEIIPEILQSHKKIHSILDFGAGKLRITPFLLKRQKNICAVEFKELAENKITKENLKICEGFGNRFWKLIFPNPFIQDTHRFDLIVLINVLQTMPVFAERLLLLQILYDKLNQNGYIFWYAMKEKTEYKIRKRYKKYICGDGIWMHDNRKTKTFYKYHNPDELDELMGISGFLLEGSFPDSINDIRLYKKSDYNLFSNTLTPEMIESQIPYDKTIEDPKDPKLKVVDESNSIKRILPNPKSLSIENLYIKTLNSIPDGPKGATNFHRLISYIIGRIFRGSLRNMAIRQEMHRGRKIIDTIYTNSAQDGFFKEINENPIINCKYVVIEAKNSAYDPENPEFDQLATYLNEKIGNFGLLICRKIENERLALERSQSFLDDNKYIIFLSKNNIIELLELFAANLFDEITNFLDTKLRSVIFRSRK